MQIFDKGKIYNFMGVKVPFLVLALFLMGGSLICVLTKGFNLGIDFSGGTLIQIRYDAPQAPLSDIRDKFNSIEALQGTSVTEFGSPNEVIIRYSSSSDSLGSDPGSYISELLKDTGEFEIRRVDVVGPKVGDALRKSGVMAVCVSLVLILIYIAVRFEFRFAVAAILSEIHDVLIVLGVISLFGTNVNLDTLAAILTIVGYSLNDTIIIFDRIREGIRDSKFNDLNYVINEAVSNTLSRTILTSLTTLMAVVVLFFFGGDMIRDFAFIVMVGIIAGTFSSVFVAAQALVLMKFDVDKYREFLAEKHRKAKEKEKMRAMYEKGRV
ncbi:MAG: protein translocase subunit SecF [Campylobacter sp.]|nr:protein translocase subunit SecF [Campylobacter sp.]